MPATEAGRLWGRRAGSEAETVGARLRRVRVVPTTGGGGAARMEAGVFGGAIVFAGASSTKLGCAPGTTSEEAAEVVACVTLLSAGALSICSAVVVSFAGALVALSTSILSNSSMCTMGAGGFDSVGAGVLDGKARGTGSADLEGVASTLFAAACVLRLTLPPNGTGTVILLVAGVAIGFGCLAGVAMG